MVPVTHLPELCLLALFKQLPLKDQITARQVCLRWRQLIDEVTQSRRRLTFFLGSPPTNTFEYWLNYKTILQFLVKEDGSPLYPTYRATEWNTLQLAHLNENTAENIVATFAAINELIVVIARVPASEAIHLVRFLSHWRHQLTTLKLYNDFAEYPDAATDDLYAAINCLSSLTHLTLHLNHLPFRDLPIVSQLSELKYRLIKASPGQFVDMLRQHDAANDLSCQIRYLSSHDAKSHLDAFTSLRDPLRQCFTRLDFLHEPVRDPVSICAHFRELTSLYIFPSVTTFRRLLRHLAQLPQLLSLHMRIHFSSILPDEQDGDQLLPQLKSVKALTLDLVMHSHNELNQLNLHWTMPAVQAIEFYFDNACKCIDCGIKSFPSSRLDLLVKSNGQNFRKCLQEIFSPLKHKCIQLRVIQYNRQDVFGSVEALLAE